MRCHTHTLTHSHSTQNNPSKQTLVDNTQTKDIAQMLSVNTHMMMTVATLIMATLPTAKQQHLLK